jgi:hypothetical protein
MAFRHLIVCAMLAAFTPTALPVFSGTAEAATQSTQKKKKPAQKKKTAEPRVKKNFRAPRPGEPNAGWTDDLPDLWPHPADLRQIRPVFHDLELSIGPKSCRLFG